MRFSSPMRKLMPSFCAIACASVIIAAASSRVSGYWQMSASVERESALIGLKVRLPQSLSQISARISSSTGALKPALTKQSETRRTRSLIEPSSSPSGNRSPSTCRTMPGATSSEAGYTTQPTMRSAGMFATSRPLGSTLRTTLPASSPPCLWKYQNGMPFCIVTTTVAGPKSSGTFRATASTWCAFMARMTMSCAPAAA